MLPTSSSTVLTVDQLSTFSGVITKGCGNQVFEYVTDIKLTKEEDHKSPDEPDEICLDTEKIDDDDLDLEELAILG